MSDDALMAEARRRGLVAEDPLISEAKKRGLVPAVPVEGRNPAASAVIEDQNRAQPHTFGEKLGMGVGDIGRGIVQGAVRLAPLFNPGDEKTATMSDEAARFVDQEIANRENKWQGERARSFDAEGNPDKGTEIVRGIGSGLATAPAIALMPAGGATIPGMIGANALQGGAQALLSPVTDTSGGYVGEKAKQVTGGAVTGAATGGIFGATGRVIRPQTSPHVQFLMDRGVTPTPGQTLGRGWASAEEKLTSIPLLGDAIKSGQRRSIEDFNRAAYNEVLQPLGSTYQGPVGHEAVRAVGDAISHEYDTLLPNLTFAVDRQFATELQNINRLAQNLTPEARAQYNRIVSSNLGTRLQSGTMDGRTFKELESALRQYQETFATGNANDRLVGNALGEVLTSLRSGLDRSNPQYIGQLANINDAWSRLTVLERAAANSTKNEGVFTPEVFLTAVKTADQRVRKRGVGRGEGNMQELGNAGNQVLGRAYPDSGTTGRAMAGMATAGGLSMISPKLALAAGAGMLPYTGPGQRAANAILARRPNSSQTLADITRMLAPAGTTAAIFGMR